jgi:hypothetical protein
MGDVSSQPEARRPNDVPPCPRSPKGTRGWAHLVRSLDLRLVRRAPDASSRLTQASAAALERSRSMASRRSWGRYTQRSLWLAVQPALEGRTDAAKKGGALLNGDEQASGRLYQPSPKGVGAYGEFCATGGGLHGSRAWPTRVRSGREPRALLRGIGEWAVLSLAVCRIRYRMRVDPAAGASPLR